MQYVVFFIFFKPERKIMLGKWEKWEFLKIGNFRKKGEIGNLEKWEFQKNGNFGKY